MALYRDDELHQAGAANGIAGYGPPSGAFFGSGPKAPSPGLAPSPNSTLISPAVGNGSDAGPGPSTESLILQHLYDSFLSGAYSDLVLRFHGESTSEFHVHKMMVCRSPLIAQMLQQGPM